jgi:hypothetical protein
VDFNLRFLSDMWAKGLILGRSFPLGGRPSWFPTGILAVTLPMQGLSVELASVSKSRAKVAIEWQITLISVSAISTSDGSSSPATMAEVCLLRSSIGLPCSPVVFPFGVVKDGFLPVAEDQSLETVLEVSPIQSILPLLLAKIPYVAKRMGMG